MKEEYQGEKRVVLFEILQKLEEICQNLAFRV